MAMLDGITNQVFDYNLPFLLHAVVETPAALNFFLFPSDQLGARTPNAHAVIRQYACLLFATVIISLSFLQRPLDALSGKLAGALAIYHVAASARAGSRLQRQMRQGRQVVLSEACLHLIAHSLCVGSMLHCCWVFYLRFLLGS